MAKRTRAMRALFQAVGECRDRTMTDAPPGAFAAAFVFPPEFRGFSGHFPGNPVLPGIAQIMAVLHACGQNAPAALLAVKSCKFLRPVAPGERVRIGGETTTSPEGLRIAATLRVGDALCAAMTLLAAGTESETDRSAVQPGNHAHP